MKLDITIFAIAVMALVRGQTEKACFGNGGAVGEENDDPDMTNLDVVRWVDAWRAHSRGLELINLIQLVDEFDKDTKL